jgi:flagellar hook-associated protein 3 FlgL
MTVRIGEFDNLRTFLLHNERESYNQAMTLERLSTLKRVNRASDDPTDYRAIRDARDQMSQTAGFQNNIETSLSKYTVMETQLNGVVDSFSRARELALSATSVLNNDLERETLADEVSQLRNNIIGRLNSRHEGSYLFSGTQTSTEPFDAAGVYSGDSNLVRIRISESDQLINNIPGDEIAFGAAGAGGPTDIMEILNNLETALRNDDDVAINAELVRMRDAEVRLNEVVGEVGTRSARLILEQNHYSEFELELQSILSELEDADLAEEVTNLERSNTIIESQFRSQSTISQQSLLDFIG